MNKSDLFSIGQISKMFHISPSLLRYYEKIGLLIPEMIDPDSGYRYYSSRQFEGINTIRYLRLLDTPLEQIDAFLKNRDLDTIQELLLAQKETIVRKRKELELIENKISRRLEQLDDALNSRLDEIFVTTIPLRRLVFLQRKLIVHSDFNLESAIQKLEEDQDNPLIFLGKVGIQIDRNRLLAHQYDQYDAVFLLLDPEDHYQGNIVEILDQPYVGIRFKGSHDRAASYYKQLNEFIDRNDYEIIGPSQELTMIDYGFTQDEDRFVTEILIPVAGKEREK